MATERSTDGAERAAAAVAKLAEAAPAGSGRVLVVGGLAVNHTSAILGFPHEGTRDADLLIEVGAAWDDDADFGWLEQALLDGEFQDRADGWRWERGSGPDLVKVDLLCDRGPAAEQQVIALPGCTRAGAVSFSSLQYALGDPGEAVDEAHPDVRWSGPVGLVLVKALVAHARDEDRDYYDLAHLLVHAPAGAREMGAAARSQVGGGRVSVGAVIAVLAREFEDVQGRGATAFLEGTRAAGVEDDEATLRQDAVSAFTRFRAGFETDPSPERG